MIKCKLFLIALACSFCFNHIYAQDSIEIKKKSIINEHETNFNLKISFMYYTGDMNLSKKENEFKEYLKEKHPTIKYKLVPFKNEYGDWGPKDYFLNLSELSKTQQNKFIIEMNEYFKGTPSVKIILPNEQKLPTGR